jgi:hypothetical protein
LSVPSSQAHAFGVSSSVLARANPAGKRIHMGPPMASGGVNPFSPSLPHTSIRNWPRHRFHEAPRGQQGAGARSALTAKMSPIELDSSGWGRLSRTNDVFTQLIMEAFL